MNKKYYVIREKRCVLLKGKNGFQMVVMYQSVREATQMAKRLAKNLNIQYRR
jgi:hypothetical protein